MSSDIHNQGSEPAAKASFESPPVNSDADIGTKTDGALRTDPGHPFRELPAEVSNSLARLAQSDPQKEAQQLLAAGSVSQPPADLSGRANEEAADKPGPLGIYPGLRPTSPKPPSFSAEPLTIPPEPGLPSREPNVDLPGLMTDTGAAGGKPPTRPPVQPSPAADTPPKPTAKPTEVKLPKLPFDMDEFVREAEEHKRGATVMREVKALEDVIRDLHRRGVPLGAIHRGLAKREMVGCSRTRFGEVCGELFPDIFGKHRRREV